MLLSPYTSVNPVSGIVGTLFQFSFRARGAHLPPPCARKVIDNKNRSPHVENPTGGAAAREDPGESQHNLKRICALVTHYTHHTGAAVQVKLVVASRSGLAARSSSRASKNCLVYLYLSSIGLSGSRRRSMHHACCASGRIGRRGLDGW